jgi:hypothetical protein
LENKKDILNSDAGNGDAQNLPIHDSVVRPSEFSFIQSKMREYFSHDYNARNDRKLVNLQMKYQMQGIGAFWCIAEMLYEEGGKMRKEYDRIAFELRCDKNVIQAVIEGFELFNFDNDFFWSESVSRRLGQRKNKSLKASNSAKKRWGQSERKANALQTDSDGNAIKVKENKVKEIKEKKIKVNNILLFTPFMEAYNNFILEQTTVPADITPADGKILKSIIAYFQKIARDKNATPENVDTEALNMWKYVLSHYDKWDDFSKKNLKITGIKYNLVNIIKTIKDGKGQKGKPDYSALRQEIRNRNNLSKVNTGNP